MDWPNHLKSLAIQWVFKIAHPREASWQKLMNVWVPNIKIKLFSNLGALDKKKILRAIPDGATYIKNAIKQFWSLGLRQNIFDDNGELLKEARDPDFLSSIPIFNNFIFKIRTRGEWVDTLSRMGLQDLGDLFLNQKIRTAAELRRRVLDFFPAPRAPGPALREWRATISKALSIIRRVITLIPLKIKQALSVLSKPFGNDIVYYEEADGTPCYGRIQGNTLFKLWTDESGFYTGIEEINITN